MNKPICTVYEPSKRYREKVIRDIRFFVKNLVLQIQGKGFSFATVTFEDIAGFRVLDERDLCEFWNQYSEPNGWLYEVHSGGWMELESYREFFNSPSSIKSLKEYLVVDDMCVSVMCVKPPIINDEGTNPEITKQSRTSFRRVFFDTAPRWVSKRSE